MSRQGVTVTPGPISEIGARVAIIDGGPTSSRPAAPSALRSMPSAAATSRSPGSWPTPEQDAEGNLAGDSGQDSRQRELDTGRRRAPAIDVRDGMWTMRGI